MLDFLGWGTLIVNFFIIGYLLVALFAARSERREIRALQRQLYEIYVDAHVKNPQIALLIKGMLK